MGAGLGANMLNMGAIESAIESVPGHHAQHALLTSNGSAAQLRTLQSASFAGNPWRWLLFAPPGDPNIT